jgi:hypothetical protein
MASTYRRPSATDLSLSAASGGNLSKSLVEFVLQYADEVADQPLG